MEATRAPVPRDRFANFRQGRALLFGVQVVCLVAMVASIATRAWYEHLWVALLLTALTIVAFLPAVLRRQERRWWFYYVAGIYAYTIARSLADDAGFAVRTQYPAEFDRWLFLGLQPVTWLQERFFDPTAISLLDWAAVWVHWSFFVVPHLLAVTIFVRWRRWFPEYVMLLVGTMWVGLVFFFVVPTAPPWLASQFGSVDRVYRVMDFVGGRVSLATYRHFYASLGEPNSVAAVPSIHMATTYGLYLWARYRLPGIAPLLLVYAGVMALALVYLGEHYVFDLLVGIACATAVGVSVELVAPRVARRELPKPVPVPTDR